jgi:DNA mismatch repair protein MSH3
MAPPPSSQKKKQQSISSFFTSKSSVASKPAQTSPPATSARPSTSSSAPQIDEDNVLEQRVSSNSKRKLDTNSDEENQEPRAKRPRSSPDATSRNRTVINGQPKESSIAAIEQRPTVVSSGEKPPTRTSRYIFSSSAAQTEEEEESAESTRQKALLHKRFVQKLGKPDSIADIKRRYNNNLTQGQGENGENGEDEEGQEDDEPAPKTTKGKKGGARANGKLTPMEVQYLEIKRKHLDTIIAYEVGYKFRFFGEDARVAAKELGIFCIPGKFRYDSRIYRLCFMC